MFWTPFVDIGKTMLSIKSGKKSMMRGAIMIDRNKIQKTLIKDIDDWELQDLIDFAKSVYGEYLAGLSEAELEREYEAYIGLNNIELEPYLKNN